MMNQNKEVEFIVQKILDKRQRIGSTEYLVLWKGYKVDQASWEPAEHLQHASKRIRCFQRRRKQQQKKLKRRSIRQRLIRSQNQLYPSQKLKSYQALKDLIQGGAPEHPPIFEVKPRNSEDQAEPMTFEKFIDRPYNQLIKVERYSTSQGGWIEKLETCEQIIGKNAARQRFRNGAYQDRINIQSISILEGEYMVRFLKDQKHFQCELKKLQYLCPNEIIDYLLLRYDPTTKALLRPINNSQIEIQPEDSDMSNGQV